MSEVFKKMLTPAGLEDPSAPRHLVSAKSKQHGQKVDITVKWDHPEYTLGLPINHYMVRKAALILPWVFPSNIRQWITLKATCLIVCI